MWFQIAVFQRCEKKWRGDELSESVKTFDSLRAWKDVSGVGEEKRLENIFRTRLHLAKPKYTFALPFRKEVAKSWKQRVFEKKKLTVDCQVWL